MERFFYLTPAEQEIDAMMQAEREAERRLHAINDVDDDDTPRCAHIQHILGGDCPICTPDYCPRCFAIAEEECTCSDSDE